MTSNSPDRIAVFGGNPPPGRAIGGARHYRAPRLHGIGELRRLLAAIHAGAFDTVVVYARWRGHTATSKIRSACRRRGVAFFIVGSPGADRY